MVDQSALSALIGSTRAARTAGRSAATTAVAMQSRAAAASFEIMKRERIGCALSFDAHFADAGFEVLGPNPRAKR